MSLLRKLLEWLLERLGLLQPPSDLVSLEIDMSNGRLTWTLPSVSPRQRELDYVRIDSHVEGVNDFTEIARVPVADAPELIIQDIAPGNWFFRGVVVDKGGKESQNPKTASLQVPFDPPGDLQTFDAALV